jgi:hypothetical protein
MGWVPRGVRNVPKIGSLAAMAAFAAIVLYGIA